MIMHDDNENAVDDYQPPGRRPPGGSAQARCPAMILGKLGTCTPYEGSVRMAPPHISQGTPRLRCCGCSRQPRSHCCWRSPPPQTPLQLQQCPQGLGSSTPPFSPPAPP